ncbi:hypothetical protein HSBAA_57130 [Vreelandella sulfidaeris]|uniref:Uncharacterized protein n=1 Tax=Vreelandella sulfidaeris TaxID=115553 RepID=A0A455UFF8_9GAMM|nr:hypothetical protein HSBAA_57130 [Halomonas sulfidaeris]
MHYLLKRTLLVTGATLFSSGMVYAQTPDLSDPPEIDGATVEDHGSVTLRMGLGLAESSPQYISSRYFADILNHRTEGRINVHIFPNSQLGDDVQMMEMLQTGTLDMTYPSSSPRPATSKSWLFSTYPSCYPPGKRPLKPCAAMPPRRCSTRLTVLA